MPLLTHSQIDTFWRDGYVVLPEILASAELERIRKRTGDIANGRAPAPEQVSGISVLQVEPSLVDKARAADRLDELRKLNLPSWFDDDFRALARGARIVDAIEQLVGPDIYLLSDQIFLKPPFQGSAKEWHQDSGAWTHLLPPSQVTCWIALDDATIQNGCLHYIRGSHRLGLLSEQQIQRLVKEDAPANEVPVEVPAGGAVLHHSLTAHSSGPNETPNRRRGWALHYMASDTRDLRPPTLVSVEPIHVRGKANARLEAAARATAG
jgi:ectoine hydroxylase-related dioxygenase (phytanoyl-CoA dioxygenase family)